MTKNLPPLPKLLAHTHLLTERQRRQGSIGPVGPLLCIHAEGLRDGQPVAVDRFFAGDCSPQAALLAMRNYGPERDHLLFVVDAPPNRQRAFVRAGFRLVEVQWLMNYALAEWQPRADVPTTVYIRRAIGPVDAMTINAIDGLETIPLDEIDDSGLVHYYILAQDKPIAYGRWAGYDARTAWVSHIFTAPDARRHGYAALLMARILADCQEAGVDRSLLLATEMAHPLYTRLGYRNIAPVAILQAPPARLRRR